MFCEPVPVWRVHTTLPDMGKVSYHICELQDRTYQATSELAPGAVVHKNSFEEAGADILRHIASRMVEREP